MIRITFYCGILLFSYNTTIAQTQMEMNASAEKRYKATDLQLNKVYKQLLGMLSDKEKQLLVNAEKSWLLYRDNHCKFEKAVYEGGSIQPLIYFNCLEELTKKRIAELKASIKDRNM